MLDPHDRTLLLDALRPPEGFRFDEAIATTYSLDLVALLAAPLGFTLTTVTGNPSAEWDSDTALTILRSLRRHAAQMTVFCDGARLAIPRVRTPLYTLLEPALVPAKAPVTGAAFHPKLWLLRYEPDGIEARPRYRVLVLTRNLTFDRSLDLVVGLEGEVRSSTTRVRAAVPISKFLSALGSMSVAKLSKEHAERIQRFADEVGRTEFKAKPPFQEDAWQFFSYGYPGSDTGFPIPERVRRRLVMSPFVSSSLLAELSETPAETILFSRLASLDAEPASVLAGFTKVFIPRQELQDFDPEERSDSAGEKSIRATDLHAKLYIDEPGRGDASWLVGSANATSAAFQRNVEVLLELRGRQKDVGIDVLMADSKSRTDFLDLWQQYERSGDATPEEKDEAELALEAAAGVLGALPWYATVEGQGDERYVVTLHPSDQAAAQLPEGARVSIWPLLLSADVGRPLADPSLLVWHDLALASLSAFWVADITVSVSGQTASSSQLLFAPLHGAPEGRAEAVTRYLLKDQNAVIRFLHLLLDTSEDHVALPEDATAQDPTTTDGRTNGVSIAGLLESMLRALEARPERVEEAGRVIRDLAATEEGRTRLPDGLLQVWESVEAARQELAK